MKDQPLLDDASPTALSVGYVADYYLEKDLKEDHADYSADAGDGDDESFNDEDDNDDDDDEDEEAFEDEDDDEEEEVHLALADSYAVPVVDPVPSARDIEAFKTDESAPTPPLPRSIQIVIPLSQTQLHRAQKTVRPQTHIPFPSEAEDEIVKAMQEIASTTLEGVNQRVTELANTVRDRPCHRHTAILFGREATYARRAWAGSKDMSATIEAHVRTLEAQVATLMAQTSSLQTQLTTSLGRIQTLEARDPEHQDEPAKLSLYGMLSIIENATKEKNHQNNNHHYINDAQIKVLIARGVADGLAKRDVDLSRNGNDNHDSGDNGRRRMPVARECTYTNFLKCQPLNFKGTEGVVAATVGIPASLRRIPKNLLDRVSQLSSRSQTGASQSKQSMGCHEFDSWKNLTSHLPRACLMLALVGFPSSL
nr:hypothetical protein [Tanacetum cinerariifolium]